ncbi:MAG: response regulator [Bacteroidetes bacterium]|jgi:response regulator of citrate/malate metabolism|nr:response regulator [Bacteroidota bacterium]
MASKRRILLIEDDFLQSFAVKLIVEDLSFEIVGIADNGAEAIEIAASEKPDIILMDVVLLGDLSGIDTAIDIQKSLDICLVYITGLIDIKVFKNLDESDYVDILYKPIHKNALLSALNKCTSSD